MICILHALRNVASLFVIKSVKLSSLGHCTLLGKIFFESNLIWSCLFSGLTNETRLPCRYLAAAVAAIVGPSTLADSGLHFVWNIDHSLVI